jgi:hypothetical protein
MSASYNIQENTSYQDIETNPAVFSKASCFSKEKWSAEGRLQDTGIKKEITGTASCLIQFILMIYTGTDDFFILLRISGSDPAWTISCTKSLCVPHQSFNHGTTLFIIRIENPSVI